MKAVPEPVTPGVDVTAAAELEDTGAAVALDDSDALARSDD